MCHSRELALHALAVERRLQSQQRQSGRRSNIGKSALGPGAVPVQRESEQEDGTAGDDETELETGLRDALTRTGLQSTIEIDRVVQEEMDLGQGFHDFAHADAAQSYSSADSRVDSILQCMESAEEEPHENIVSPIASDRDRTRMDFAQMNRGRDVDIYKGAGLGKLGLRRIMHGYQARHRLKEEALKDTVRLLQAVCPQEESSFPSLASVAGTNEDTIGGVKVQVVHCCVRDHLLFRNPHPKHDPAGERQFAELTKCPKCGEARYVANSKGELHPRRVLRYLELAEVLRVLMQRPDFARSIDRALPENIPDGLNPDLMSVRVLTVQL